jgi:hypothetical protein
LIPWKDHLPVTEDELRHRPLRIHIHDELRSRRLLVDPKGVGRTDEARVHHVVFHLDRIHVST